MRYPKLLSTLFRCAIQKLSDSGYELIRLTKAAIAACEAT